MNIGLCRVSSISQKDNTSLSNQKRMIKDYCNMYGIELSNIISECYSGTTSNRNELNELTELVENGNVESVVGRDNNSGIVRSGDILKHLRTQEILKGHFNINTPATRAIVVNFI